MEIGTMLGRLRRFFSRAPTAGTDSGDELDLDVLFVELNELLAKNKIKLVENERLMDKVELECKSAEFYVKSFGDILNDVSKRCSLRRISSLRKRVKRLNHCSTIYNDNITMHMHMADRLEDIRISGLKTVTSDMLESIVLDSEEHYQKHRDLVNSVKAMDGPDDENDPELKALAKELGV